MSDVEDDLEFYTALEDELYKENAIVDSDDEIDSELEAQLYQNVHFASSLITTPSENVEDKNHLTENPNFPTNLLAKKTELESSDNYSKPTVPKTSTGLICLAHREGEQVTSKYPEVELVFSSERKNPKDSKSKGDSTLFLNSSQVVGDDNTENDGWELHEADLRLAGSKSKSMRGKSSKIRCFNCNERGHRTFECTQPKKEKVCSLCGALGHRRPECPNELCFNCLEPGHQLRQCPKPRCRPGDTCRRCHAYGHFENICPDKWRQYHLTIKQGDIITSKLQFKPVQDQVYCYNCGEEGHLGHECIEERPDGRFAGAFPFVVKYDRFTAGSSKDNDRHNLHYRSDQYHRPNDQERQRVYYDESGKRSKRRKTEDHWNYEDQYDDRGWNYSRDNWRMMEEPINHSDNWANYGFSEISETANRVGGNGGTKNGKKKKKRKNKVKLQGETINVTVTDDVNKNANRKNRKRKRKKESEMNVYNNGDVSANGFLNTWVTATNKKKTKRSKKRKVHNKVVAPTMKSNPADTFYSNGCWNGKKAKLNRNQTKGSVHSSLHKRTETKKHRKPKPHQTTKGNDSRKVYHDFNGFV